MKPEELKKLTHLDKLKLIREIAKQALKLDTHIDDTSQTIESILYVASNGEEGEHWARTYLWDGMRNKNQEPTHEKGVARCVYQMCDETKAQLKSAFSRIRGNQDDGPIGNHWTAKAVSFLLLYGKNIFTYEETLELFNMLGGFQREAVDEMIAIMMDAWKAKE